MTASLLTRMIHTRGFGLAVSLLALIGAGAFFMWGSGVIIPGDKGTVFPSANEWYSSSWVNFGSAIGWTCLTVVMMLLINKVYNILRSSTTLNMALFMAMMLATPDLMTHFYTGTVLALVVPLCQYYLFSCFRNPGATRHVFIIFLLLSFCAAFQYCFVFYIPVFLIGLGQMQIFNWRSFLAAILGVITPWWMIFGFGIAAPSDVTLPVFESIFSVFPTDDTLLLLVTIGFTVFVAVLTFVLNILKTIAYNARARAMNGSYTVLLFFTIVAACVDYRDIISYVPLLNYCAAIETTHYFSTHRGEKSFIPVLIIFAVYAAIFACQTVI